ncbi:MAG: glycosyltransferase family 4 protein [Synechococcaceae cyanobacterium]
MATVAWKQAIGLSEFQQVHVVSDGFSNFRLHAASHSDRALTLERLGRPDFSFLHRFGFLPREIAWIYLVIACTHRYLKAVSARSQSDSVAPVAVICHSHPVAAFLSRWFGDRIRIVMISHGDIFHRPPKTYDPAITWLYRCTTRPAHLGAALNVALSPVMEARIRSHGTNNATIVMIPNGIDARDIGLDKKPETLDSHWQQNPLKILFVGRIMTLKGVDVLIEAAARLKKRGVDFSIAMIGVSTPDYGLMLQESIHENKLDEMVRVVGCVSRNDLSHHYLGAHVVVVPSRDDPLPTVVLEAMACGRPVVGSDLGGLRLMVEHGRTGLLVPVNDEQALAEALILLNEKRELMAAMGEAGLSRLADFSWASNVNSLQHCIQEIINRPGPQHSRRKGPRKK